VPDAVAALKERGMRLGIVSTKYRRRIEKILDRDGLLSSFDTIIGGDDVTRHKLDPQPIHMALASLGVPVDKAVYVGDSLPDAQAAQAAGVRFVAALSGTTELHEFEEYAMAGYVSTVNRTDFVEVLERISNGSS
jgi:phosphoglycolate phosphatase